MTEPREVEIKFRVPDIAALETKLRSAGFTEKTPPTHEMNTLYDDADALRSRGELLRLRNYGGKWKVTHKSKGDIGGRHKSRVERETAVADGETLHAIFASLGFVPTFRYEKYRSEWSDGQGDVVVDHTPVGDIAEIEGTPEWIDATAAKLGVGHRDYITKSYAELFLDWKRETGSKAQNMTFAECGVTAGSD